MGINLKQLATGVTKPAVDEKEIVRVQEVAPGEVQERSALPTPETTPIDPDSLVQPGFDKVTFNFVSAVGAASSLYLGILATAAEAAQLGLAGVVPIPFNGNAGATDDFGATAPKLLGWSERVRRSPILVNKIVITYPNTAAGLLQASRPLETINIDSDANQCNRAGILRTINTDFNSIIWEGSPLPIGGEHGVRYQMDDAAGAIGFEIHYAARSVPTFKSVG